MSILNTLSDNKGARKSSKRVCRGIGSGKGKTGGRGIKGQKSRSGVAIAGFEGGQMPIHRRLPKRGFNNYTRKEFEIINFEKLQEFIDAGKLDSSKEITKESLENAGLIKNNKDGVKILAKGELKAVLTVKIDAISESARKAIESNGGKVILSTSVEKAESKKSE